ncbi:MAG: hypothetical protein NTV43_15485 [Methylococcales bacterium]|nr:hypothetical protein [Methylococcales bacterium]
MRVRFPVLQFLLFLCALFAFSPVFAKSDGRAQSSPLAVSQTSVTLKVGGVATLTVTNTSGTVSASSGDKSIVTAAYANKVLTLKGVKAGSTKVTVKDSKTSVSIAVKVDAVIVSSLTASPTSVVMVVGATSGITVSNASGTVTVSSANKAVATASYASGIVTVKGVAAGSTTLIIKDSKQTLTLPVTITAVPVPPVAGNYTLLAWNDLGMHCMDGLDFSVFAILPPYNTLHAQLKDKAGKLVTSGVTLTYEAVADSTGSINTNSYTKTNFWGWVGSLVGLQPANDIGLNLDGLATGNPAPGNETPSLVPAPMAYNTEYRWFEAEGIPITPFDDQGKKNFYPTVKVVAKDVNGKQLASTTTVLPVSDEMTCKACHTSTASSNPAEVAAKPAAGWVNDANLDKDWKRNILRLHDEKQLTNSLYQSALIQSGYNTGGLLATADAGKPVLCAGCHASNAYFDKQNKKTVMGGMAGIRPFTQVLHTKHALVKDPSTQLALDSNGDRTACYLCHPGSATKCLRGAMSKAADTSGKLMSCQSCHGNMAAVGSPARQGWYNEPTCESCHNSAATNKRAMSALNASGVAIVPSDHTFATNANAPVPGLNLYRFSTGHGGLQCEACHGATHAEYPSSHVDDNTQSLAVQGHTGTIAECKACHSVVPTTVNGGPHGMHTTGDAWVKAHESANKNGTATTPSCAYCHGTTSAGTPLSAIKVAKTVNAGDFGIKNWPVAYQVSCFSCHNGPNP